MIESIYLGDTCLGEHGEFKFHHANCFENYETVQILATFRGEALPECFFLDMKRRTIDGRNTFVVLDIDPTEVARLLWNVIRNHLASKGIILFPDPQA